MIFNTGLVKTTTDANGKVTTFEYRDPVTQTIEPLDRLRRIVRPTGDGSTIYSYSDTPGNLYVRTQTELDSSRSLDSYQFFDGLGRPSRTFNWEGSTYVVADTQYDNMGRVFRVSNPYRTTILNDPNINPAGHWTTNQYDGLGRVLSVAAPASAAVITSYFGNQVTVTDQAGKKRRSSTDALDRLTAVDELNVNSSLYAQTTYGYDLLGNLLAVYQATNSRSFNYDSLSRLRSAINPEQIGSITYTYDVNSNLKTKLDPNGITTTYDYDDLNRIKMRTYTGGLIATPQVTYTYDSATNGKGRLASASAAGVSTYNYTAYDAMGRVTACNQAMVGGSTYSMSATYNLAGLIVDETYPSNKVIHTEYDDAGRVAGVKNAASTGYYAGAAATDSTNRIQYAANGAVADMKLGNNLWERTTFNPRLQPTQIRLGTSGTPSSVVQLDYTYGVMVGSTLDTSQNNGNIQSQTVTVGSHIIKQSYTYDQVNRLLSAAETYNQNARWTQSYTFDQVGNRTGLTNTGPDVLPTDHTPTVSSSTNRISEAGYVYDNAGNLKDEPAALNKHYQYDAENRLVNFNSGSAQYLYDGDGRRVKKIVVVNQTTTTTVFVYNVAGQLIAEYTSDPVPPPAGGGGTSYLTTDHLGSTRVVTGTNPAQPVKGRYDYLPYGEELPSTVGGRDNVGGYGGADSTRQKFTQKERDNESGLDYFLARYYSSAQGRFTSVDPMTITPGRVVDPQQINLYAYVRNNPFAYVDPTGMLIDVSHLSKDDLKKWRRIVEVAHQKDSKGNYVNPKLHEIYSRLEGDMRTFIIENHSFGDKSGTIGETNITKHNGKDDFTEAVIQIDFKKAKSLENAVAADLVPRFNKFEGILDQGDRGVDARRAEVFGHEGSHAVFDLDNPAEAVKLQMQLAERDAALAALPKKGRYPLPPDVLQKMNDATRALEPTERFAQQAEKIVNGELRAWIKQKP